MKDHDTAWLGDWLAEGRSSFLRRHDLLEELWRGSDPEPADARGLRRAVEAGLASLEQGGTVLATQFRTPKKYQLFVQYDGGAVRPGTAWSWSWREMFCQIAFAAELVLDHGWEAREVELEVDRLDVAAGDDPVHAPSLLAEAKLKDDGPSGLTAMLAVFNELAGGDLAAVSQQVRRNAVPKYEGLLRLRPETFVAVAPGVRRWFKTTYLETDRAVLTPSTDARHVVATRDLLASDKPPTSTR